MKTKFAILIFLVHLFVSANVFAGDIPETIFSNTIDNQKAFFIGEVTVINDKKIEIKPTKTMIGEVQTEPIKLDKNYKYSEFNRYFETGDYVVAVLLDNNKLFKEWIYEADSLDPNSLKLITNADDPSGMTLRYQGYINNGDYIKVQKKLENKLKEKEDFKNWNKKYNSHFSSFKTDFIKKLTLSLENI